jgi:hypothetical protein
MTVGPSTKENASRRLPLQKDAIAVFIAFLVVGFLIAQPCLCREGAVAGLYKSIFYLIVAVRLLYGILKRNLRRSDFALWVGGFVLFCVIAESLY